jgi:sugar phosphate isomerase/epimerase
MKLGINEHILSKEIGFEASMRFLKELGFDGIDFCFYERNAEFEGDDYREIAQAYKNICDTHQLKVFQMHANWFKSDDDEAEKAYKIHMNERALEVASILTCPYVVFHATKFKGYYSSDLIQQKANAYNLELFAHYLKIAEQHQVHLAIENMFGYITNTVRPADTIFSTASQMNQYMDHLGERCVACMDTGHAYIAQQKLADMVASLNQRLKVLHIHDAIMTEDAHLVPSLGLIDWPAFFTSLKAMGFKGALSLEILPPSSIGVQSYIQYGYEIMRHFIDTYWSET